MKSIVGLVPARGGSKGLPGKNIKPLAGKPLIAWTLEAARASGVVNRLIVSTDDPAIAQAARDHGAEVPFLRPAALSRDETSALDVALHALDWLESQGALPEFLLWLQPTSPLRTSQDITAGTALMDQTHAPAVLGVCEVKVHPLDVLSLDSQGALGPYLPGGLRSVRRQDLPPAYQLNGAFYLNRTALLRSQRTFIPPGSKPLVMPPERSIDIDSAWDFFLAESLLQGQRL